MTAAGAPVAEAIACLRRVLGARRFLVRSEADMQDQVAAVLFTDALFVVDREVLSSSGRFDLQCRTATGETIVLELKLRGQVSAVERQAQRYALTPGVDGVVVVTMSRRMEMQLNSLPELGGKPFAVIALRSW